MNYVKGLKKCSSTFIYALVGILIVSQRTNSPLIPAAKEFEKLFKLLIQIVCSICESERGKPRSHSLLKLDSLVSGKFRDVDT